MRPVYLIIFGLLVLVQSSTVLAGPKKSSSSPKLVVVIVVDQLRPDYLERIGSGLMKEGTVYSNAYLKYANTETAPGHAAIATGVDPRVHGIVANSWIPKGSDAPEYSVSDTTVKTLLPGGNTTEGRSPKNLLFPAIGDSLIEQNPDNKVFSVSLKDRAAILTSGQRGKAFWYSNEAQAFVTSSYYYDSYPNWLESLTAECSAVPDPRDSKGDLLTLDLALNLVDREKLGLRAGKDLLYVNLSQTDRVGHRYGWDSPEMKEHLLTVGRGLDTFIRSIKSRIGADRIAFLLTADHGAISDKDLTGGSVRSMKRFYSSEEFGINLSERIRERFGIKERVYSFLHPYLYLKDSVIKDHKVEPKQLIEFIAEQLKREGVVEQAYISKKFQEPGLKFHRGLFALVGDNFFPSRSGDLYLIPKRGTFIHDDEDSILKFFYVLHGSPWDYDSHVPLVVVGPGFKAGRTVEKNIDLASVAATVGYWLGLPVNPERAAAIEP